MTNRQPATPPRGTRPHPFRFPPAPPPEVTLRPLPSPATGLPRLPVSPSLRAVPTTPADRNGCIRRLLPRSTRPSPNLRRVGVHIFTFEACSGFTRVRPQGRSTAQGGLCHRASVPPVTRQDRLSATRSNRQLSGWILPPLVLRAVGAHCDFRVNGLSERLLRQAKPWRGG